MVKMGGDDNDLIFEDGIRSFNQADDIPGLDFLIV